MEYLPFDKEKSRDYMMQQQQQQERQASVGVAPMFPLVLPPSPGGQIALGDDTSLASFDTPGIFLQDPLGDTEGGEGDYSTGIGQNDVNNNNHNNAPATTGAGTISRQAMMVLLENLHAGINLLPSEITADYLTAKRRAPELVDKESDPIKALIRNDWDPWASAERLCNYWRLRREIFQQAGEDKDRWLLPLDLSGKGALRQEEIRLLSSGAICLATNEQGRQVLIYDLKRAQGPTEFVSRARCVQYLQTHWATNVSRQEGYDLILCASSSLGARPNKRNGELLREENASLTRLRHICIVHDMGDVRKMLVRYCGAFISRLVKRWKGVYPHMVCEDTQSATLSKLKEIGMDPSCIPEEYGGTWKFRDFCETIEKQIQIDTNRNMPADASQILPDRQVNESMPVVQTMAPQFPSLAVAQPNSTENPQLLAGSGGGGGGIAAAPELYTTNLVLQACAELDKTNKKAHRDKDFYLKRNAAYSRRNYLRRKEKNQALQQEHEQLLQQKGALQLENERLEGLLQEAKSMVADLE